VGAGDGLIRDWSWLRGADLRGFGGAATLVLFPPDIIAVVIGHTKRVEEDKSTAAGIFAIVE
jgi:hypothetical protein